VIILNKQGQLTMNKFSKAILVSLVALTSSVVIGVSWKVGRLKDSVVLLQVASCSAGLVKSSLDIADRLQDKSERSEKKPKNQLDCGNKDN
jgi:hypothetical protein